MFSNFVLDNLEICDMYSVFLGIFFQKYIDFYVIGKFFQSTFYEIMAKNYFYEPKKIFLLFFGQSIIKIIFNSA